MSRNRIPPKGRSLGDKKPELIPEWGKSNELTPWEVYPNSTTTINWVCSRCGYIWEAECASRKYGKYCRECRKEVRFPPLEKTLGYTNYGLVFEWSSKNKCSPFEVYRTESTHKRWWKCPKGHEDYEATCSDKVLKNSFCPTCSHKGPPPLEESLGFKRADLIFEWSEENEKSIWEVWPGSKYRAKWVCDEGHTWEAWVSQRNADKHQTNCPICWYVRMGFEKSVPPYSLSLEYLRPDLMPEWSPKNDRKPSEVYAGSDVDRIWVCSKGHEYLKTPKAICKQKRRCPYCSGKKVLKGFNDLKTTHPEICGEWDYEKNSFLPEQVLVGSHNKVWWKCSEGHSWYAEIRSRINQKQRSGTTCKVCKEWGTSNAEKMLREALIPFGAVPNEYMVGRYRVDIYFPDSKTVVEYDGSWAHSHPGSIERDKRKSLEILEKGYKVIRVRTRYKKYHKLGSLGIENKNYHELFCDEFINNIEDSLDIGQILSLIGYER